MIAVNAGYGFAHPPRRLALRSISRRYRDSASLYRPDIWGRARAFRGFSVSRESSDVHRIASAVTITHGGGGGGGGGGGYVTVSNRRNEASAGKIAPDNMPVES